MWVLILYMYDGTVSPSDAVALTNISGFVSEQSCIDAGNSAKKLVSNTLKNSRFICVKH